MNRLLLAFKFLTIIPLKDTGNVSEEDVGKSTSWFPLVGLLEGALLIALSWIFLKVFPAEVNNGLLVLAMAVINGGLHLDGTADTFDAIASRGSNEKKLEIMKNSTIGPVGVAAIVFVILIKYLLLNALFFRTSVADYYTALLLMPVMCRWIIVPVIFHSRSARQDGLGRTFIEHTGRNELVTATLITVLITVLISIFTAQSQLLTLHLMFVMPVLYLFCFAAVLFFNKNLNGMTGDSFGAVFEVSILLFLAMRVIWSQKFI